MLSHKKEQTMHYEAWNKHANYKWTKPEMVFFFILYCNQIIGLLIIGLPISQNHKWNLQNEFRF